MNWVPMRERPKYREMKNAINDRLDEYWVAICEPEKALKYISACEQVVLSSFRLLKYIKDQLGINHWVDPDKIGETSDAAVSFYCLSEKENFKEESEVLEVLSRAAYREMKAVREQEEEVWR